MLNRSQIAHEYLLKMLENPEVFKHGLIEHIAQTAWSLADAMRDQEKSRVVPFCFENICGKEDENE